MGYERTHSFPNKDSRTPQPTTQFRSRPFAAPVQMKPKGQPTPEQSENEAFNHHKFEAFGLQLKKESGTITPVEQERLGVLQAKMNDFRAQRLERASRFGFDISKVSFTPREGQAAPQLQPLWRQGIAREPKEEARSPFDSPQQSSVSPIQAKLTIGEPGDKYEQEADRVASQVVEQINAPATAQSAQGQSVQRQDEPEEELQRQPSSSNIQRSPLSPEVQREAMPEKDDLQAKSILQRREALGGGETSMDLDTAINSARGGGQPLDAGLQRSMGQAMGADFSGVRVHTDAQSDQLNQSIQAKAFTTGQDVFFRQGEYNPASRGGQELIAHELTHVVQQNGGAMQQSPQPHGQLPQHPVTEAPSVLMGDGEIQGRGEMTGNSQVSLSKESASLGIDAAAICQNPTQNVVQRAVLKSRKTKKWYSDRDESRQFDTKAEAIEHDRELSNAEKQEIIDQQEQKKAQRIEKRKRKLEEDFKGYTPPPQSKNARVYKENDKKYDDIGVTFLTPGNVKKFMEKQFADRGADQFQTQVIELGGHYHVIAPGTDIGLTPALLRPDLKETPEDLIPLSRQGQAKTYNALSKGLDEIVKKNTTDERSIEQTRQRVGKDIMRITRSNPVEGSIKYTKEELEILNEVAAVLRLDKGRVPNATKYIKDTITEGKYSFTELLGPSKKYEGAGKGGVEKLRGKAVEDGYKSEGSDIERGEPEEEIGNCSQQKVGLVENQVADEQTKLS